MNGAFYSHTIQIPIPATQCSTNVVASVGRVGGEHNFGHCCYNYPSILCDCPLRCFNCFFAKKLAAGHYTFSDKCPLKKNMHRYSSALANPMTTS
jgi:hypothetical protein